MRRPNEFEKTPAGTLTARAAIAIIKPMFDEHAF